MSETVWFCGVGGKIGARRGLMGQSKTEKEQIRPWRGGD